MLLDCTCSGGRHKRSYSTIQGIDPILPVDVYIPGCRPRPEGLIYEMMKLYESRLRLQRAGCRQYGSAKAQHVSGATHWGLRWRPTHWWANESFFGRLGTPAGRDGRTSSTTVRGGAHMQRLEFRAA
jgi:hypothetical protein